MTARVRILLGVLAGVVALGAAFFLLRGGPSASEAAPVIKPLHPVAQKKRLASRAAWRSGKPKAKVAAKPKVAKPKVAKPKVAKPKVAKPKAKRHQPAVVHGLPAPLAAALARHSVVVVSLFAPGSAVSEMARDEAKAGAAEAHAAFVAVSVASEAQARALTDLVAADANAENRLLDDPAVFVFRRPSNLYVRLNGFVDRDTVAQATENASLGVPAP